MTVLYLAVPDSARAALASLDPVYGSDLDDGRFVCKVRGPLGFVPAGVDVLGTDAGEVRDLITVLRAAKNAAEVGP